MNSNFHPVFEQALKPFAPPTHTQTNDFLAKRLLEELGAEAVPMSKFNDDDIYTYNTETLELQAGRGAHSEQIKILKHPLVEVRGMRAKYLGLWQYKEGATA